MKCIIFIAILLLAGVILFLLITSGVKENALSSQNAATEMQSNAMHPQEEKATETQPTTPPPEDKSDREKNIERAGLLYDLIFKDYTVQNTDYMKYFNPSNPDEKEFAYMWPYMQAHAMANAMLESDKENSIYKENLLKIIRGLENYRSIFAEEVCYQSYPTEFGGGDTFYDDNIWIALELLRSCKLLNDPRLLQTAEDIFKYVIGGWNDMKGGLYWKESDCNIMTTCTNAPTAIAGAKLYIETGNQSYLDWSIKLYGWLKANLLSENGVFWDHISEDGKIEKTTWTYNTGMMISAAVWLYEDTHKQEYLKDAAYFAESAFLRFPRPDSTKGLSLYPDTPWFNLLLFQGFIDLYRVDGNREYIDSMISNLDYAWEQSRDGLGYIYPSLNGGLIENYRYHSLLDQASFTECYALAAAVFEQK